MFSTTSAMATAHTSGHFKQKWPPPHVEFVAGLAATQLPKTSHQSENPIRVGSSQPGPEPPRFFLWGHLKDRVYKTKPQTIADLKARIREEIEAIEEETCRNVMLNFSRRLEMCQQLQGGHLENMM